MKHIITGCLSLILIWGVSGCKDDYLERLPLDVLSTTGNLASTNELRLYMNQFYQTLPGHPDALNNFYDHDSDNILTTNVNTRIDGRLAVSNATPIEEYNTIRGINYFLANYKNATGNQTTINQYVGEARFFRAWYYFEIVKKYGDVTWVNEVLPLDQEAMQVPRDPRTMIVDSILADLDRAAELLPVQSNSASLRLHRDVALTFKSRVALNEGTWQKYHKAKGDAFYTKEITDEKIKDYLTQAKTSAQAVMNAGRWNISVSGNPLSDYGNLFFVRDLSANREVMLWRKYNVAENVGHGLSKYLATAGSDMGATLSLVDDYLTRSGKPFEGAERQKAQATYGEELLPALRDPRLSQTIAVPGKPLMPGGVVVPSFPPINLSGFLRSTTGYPIYKYLEYDDGPATRDGNFSSVPLILFRYAEVLLNYAEALAELGEDPSLIKTALKPLRDRAGMPPVDFDREYNTRPNYPFRQLDKVLQGVRRERRVELAIEGSRLTDILRWAAADVLLVGDRPIGTQFVGSNIAAENSQSGFYRSSLLYYDSAPTGKTVNFYLTGNASDSLRYIDPYKLTLPTGYHFNLGRDYLLPIQDRIVQLTGGKWAQNPGW
jgi:hypothetical protein